MPKMENGINWVAKQGLMKNKGLKTKKEKMRNEKWVCRPNMALHLKEI